MNGAQDDDVDLYKRALKQLDAGDLDEAVESLRKAIALNGEVAWYHHALGELLERQLDWSAALQAYRRALQLNPVSSKYRLAVARVSTQQTTSASAANDSVDKDSARGGTPKGDKLRLLVVEDSEVTRSWYDRVLRSEYHLIFATTGRAAMRALTTVRPSLVLLDWQLDEEEPAAGGKGSTDFADAKSGLDVCKQIKRSPYRAIPVVMLTSKKGIINKTQGKLARADRFLTKPVTAEVLHATIRELLQESRQGSVQQSNADGL